MFFSSANRPPQCVRRYGISVWTQEHKRFLRLQQSRRGLHELLRRLGFFAWTKGARGQPIEVLYLLRVHESCARSPEDLIGPHPLLLAPADKRLLKLAGAASDGAVLRLRL
jgi:hypothetical protein